jgi:hypothetical protein
MVHNLYFLLSFCHGQVDNGCPPQFIVEKVIHRQMGTTKDTKHTKMRGRQFNRKERKERKDVTEDQGKEGWGGAEFEPEKWGQGKTFNHGAERRPRITPCPTSPTG